MLKYRIVWIFYLVIVQNSFGQIDSIRLPLITGKLDAVSKYFPKYSFYITRNEELFYSDKQLNFWDEISSVLHQEMRYPKFNLVNKILIYSDKEVPYLFIHRLRNEIGKVWSGFICYKVNDFDNDDTLCYYIKGSPLTKKKIGIAGGWIYNSNRIFTKEEKVRKVKFRELEKDFFPPVLAIWQDNFSSSFFEKDTLIIKHNLKTIDYSALNITKEKTILYEGKKYDLHSDKSWEELLKDKDLLFITIDNSISYGQYCDYMSFIQKIRKGYFDGVNLRSPFIIEIPQFFHDELVYKYRLNVFKNQKKD